MTTPPFPKGFAANALYSCAQTTSSRKSGRPGVWHIARSVLIAPAVRPRFFSSFQMASFSSSSDCTPCRRFYTRADQSSCTSAARANSATTPPQSASSSTVKHSALRAAS